MDSVDTEDTQACPSTTQHPLPPANHSDSSTASKAAPIALSAFETLPVELLTHVTLEVRRSRARVRPASGNNPNPVPKRDMTSLACVGPTFLKVVQTIFYDKIKIETPEMARNYLDSATTKGGEFKTRELFVGGHIKKLANDVVMQQTEALQKLEMQYGEAYVLKSNSIARLSGLISLKLVCVLIMDFEAVKTSMQLRHLELSNCGDLPVPLLQAIFTSSAASLETVRITNVHDVNTDPFHRLRPFPPSLVLKLPNVTHFTFYDRTLNLQTSLAHCRRLEHLDIGQSKPCALKAITDQLANLSGSTITSLRLDLCELKTKTFTFKALDKVLLSPSMRNLKKLVIGMDYNGAMKGMDSKGWVVGWKAGGVAIDLVEQYHPADWM